MKHPMKIGSLLCALFLAMSISACEKSTSSSSDPDPVSSAGGSSSVTTGRSSSGGGTSSGGTSSAAPFAYKTDTVMVNYNRPNHSAAYLHFASGTLTHVAFDAWDLAISTSGGEIIANNGVWGTGVRLLKTESEDIAEDLSDLEAQVIGIVDTNSSPFAGELTQGTGSGVVYIVKDAAEAFFKVAFGSYGPMGRYSLSVVEGLDGTEVQTLSGSIAADYAFTYFDLGERANVTELLPKKDAWDVVFLRTLEFEMGAPGTYGARSSVLFNAAEGVEAVVFSDQAIASVLDLSTAEFSDDPLAIGANWYTFDHDTRVFSVNTATMGFRTVEGNYAKMQIRTFYGPDQEQFWSLVRYGYQPNGSASFPE